MEFCYGAGGAWFGKGKNEILLLGKKNQNRQKKIKRKPLQINCLQWTSGYLNCTFDGVGQGRHKEGKKNQHAHLPGSHYIRQGAEGVNGADLPTDNPV